MKKNRCYLTSKIDFERTILALFDEPSFIDGFFFDFFPPSLLNLDQKPCFLGPTIFEVPQPN